MRHAERGPLEVLRNAAGARLGGDVGFRPITTSCCVYFPEGFRVMGKAAETRAGYALLCR
jgi:hypothetical protein